MRPDAKTARKIERCSVIISPKELAVITQKLRAPAPGERWSSRAISNMLPRGDEISCFLSSLTSPSSALVSVVIPCYNQDRFLPEAIESVLAQTHSPVEIIVVDDGSPDTTSEVAERYPTVRCIRQQNQGLSGARNTGLRESRGKFLMFLDADDRLTTNAVQAHLECFAAHPDAGFVVGDIDRIHEDGSFECAPRWPILTANFYEELLKANHVANTIAVMFRRTVLETVGEFVRTISAAEDYEMLLRAARSFPSAHHRTVVAYYRRYSASMSRKGSLMLQSMHQVMHAQQEFVKGNSRLEAAWREGDTYWRDEFGTITGREILSHARRGDIGRAWKAVLAMLWYVRGRVLLLPWNNRRRIWRRIWAGLRSTPDPENQRQAQ